MSKCEESPGFSDTGETDKGPACQKNQNLLWCWAECWLPGKFVNVILCNNFLH